MKALQPVRGTHDYYGQNMALMRHIMHSALQVATHYGFHELQTPIFEFSDVFHRSLGETSDVVSKETYSFMDRGGESLTLRPEFTAAIVRAFISGGYTQQLPFKAFYAGPAFRYERPQKGRMRQFHQIGVECLGAKEPWQDAEIIACAYGMLQTLLGKDTMQASVTLELNTLGDNASRDAYRSALVEYFSDYASELSEESRVRLQKNPLRILDSKQEQDKILVANAPLFGDYFSAQAKDWFAALQELLTILALPYRVSPRLVRGLDYYTHTVFEFTTTELGAQATILAGGRYNGLVAQLGGGDIAGIGFAAGVERLMLLMQQQDWSPVATAPLLAVCVPEASLLPDALRWVAQSRQAGLACEILTQRHVGKAFKKAETIGATHFCVYDASVQQSGEITVKSLITKEERTVACEQVASEIQIKK
jgi:histidyl-tRNA synthetase